jgi:hypothetical protein
MIVAVAAVGGILIGIILALVAFHITSLQLDVRARRALERYQERTFPAREHGGDGAVKLPEDFGPGMYFAKFKDFRWHDLIVQVNGVSPCYHLRAWERLYNDLLPIKMEDISEWGPRIPNPDNPE